MDETRRGQIAVEWVKMQARKTGLITGGVFKESINYLASQPGITEEEAAEFGYLIARELYEEVRPLLPEGDASWNTGPAEPAASRAVEILERALHRIWEDKER